MNFIARTLLALLLALLVGVEEGYAAGGAGAAATQYRAIQKKDPSMKSLMDWERASEPLLQFISERPNSPEVPAVYFTAAELFEKMYRQRQFHLGLVRALYFYEQLARRFPGHNLADDGLLALGDLRRDALKDEAGARAAYFEIVDRYPNGNAAQQARSRVGILDGGQEAAAAKGAPDPEDEEIAKLREELPEGGTKTLFLSRAMPKRPLIVIDAGHGGEDLGAVGADGLAEKDVVLEIAKMLEVLLQERLRAQTVLTRRTDVFIPLAERTRIANENNADLFISVHANASEAKSASGVETYYLDNTKDKSSLKLAERENKTALDPRGADFDLSFMVSDLIQNVKLDDSVALAHYVQDSIHGTLSRYYREVNNLGVKKAPFFVLVGAHMPCILAEVSFIDHPVEGKRLSDRRYQKLLAQALFQGVQSYFEKRE